MDTIKWPFLKQSWGMQVVRSEGAYLYTSDDRKILDAAGGAIVSNIGYGREEVAEAIKQATKNNTYVLPPFLTPEREDLLDELREYWLLTTLQEFIYLLVGLRLMNLLSNLLSNTKQAEEKPRKNIILTRTLSYHGTTLNMSGISGHATRKEDWRATHQVLQ